MEHKKLAKFIISHEIFIISHGILPIFAPELYHIYMFFATTKKLSINVESLHFQMFSTKCHKYEIDKRNGHRRLRTSHGKVMEKYFIESVGTLYPL